MDPLVVGAIISLILLVVMLTGIPIAFSLGLVSLAIIYFMIGPFQFDMIAHRFYGSMEDFGLLSIPLFVFMGSVFARSQASTDLYEAISKWMGRLPGGLAVSSIIASAIFAALCGSSPATAAAIGNVGIPEMRKRGYPNGIATGCIVAGGTLGILIPPSVTMIVYGIAVEQSIGRLFIAGIVPGLILTVMFGVWSVIQYSMEMKAPAFQTAAVEAPQRYSWGEKFKALNKVWPFIMLIGGILGSLYMGLATPSEAAGVGAVLALLLVVVTYRNLNWRQLRSILLSSTNESTMILMITAAAALFAYAISYLHIPQAVAAEIIALPISRWWIMLIINIFMLVLGCFLPPVAIIVMVAPILYPIIVGLNWDPIWFGVIVTLNMEAGLITPPVGLNLYVVKGIAPDIPLTDILRGSVPYIVILFLAMVLLCVFPELATWLPNHVMGQ